MNICIDIDMYCIVNVVYATYICIYIYISSKSDKKQAKESKSKQHQATGSNSKQKQVKAIKGTQKQVKANKSTH